MRGRRGPARADWGVTLVELMLALAILAVVGVCITMMIKGAADGTRGQTDGRRHLVRMQALEAFAAQYLRPNACVLAAGTNYLVLWTGDGKDTLISNNFAVNVSEFRLLELDTTTSQLKWYTVMWPAGSSNAAIIAADLTYAATTSWYSAAQSLKSQGLLTPTVVANNVSAFTVTLDNGTPTAAKMLTLWVTIDDGVVSRTAVVPVSLRQQQAPQ